MKWRRQLNYHGSREYLPDPDREERLWNRLRVWSRRQSAKLFRAAFQSTKPELVNEDDFYSLLGTGRQNNVTARAKAACPFPLHGSGHRQTIRPTSQAHDG